MPLFTNSMMKTIWRRMSRKAYRDSFVVAHISNTVASQITRLRIANGWTQSQLAERAAMKQSRISALEDPNWTNVEVSTLQRIASAFDVALTVRFVAFSELAHRAATLSDRDLLVPKYAIETEQKPVGSDAAEGAAAAAFASMVMGQQSLSSLYNTVANQNSARATVPTIHLRDQESIIDSAIVSAEPGAMMAAKLSAAGAR